MRSTDDVREGGCQCRAVRYRMAGEPLTVCACHCTNCQRRSGSAFGMTVIVARHQMEIVQGEPARYDFTEEDGRRWTGAYCAKCTVRLWSESPQRDMMFTAPGTLDDTSWLEPVAHLWMRSAQPWVPIPDGVLTFARQPEDMGVLFRAWRERKVSGPGNPRRGGGESG